MWCGPGERDAMGVQELLRNLIQEQVGRVLQHVKYNVRGDLDGGQISTTRTVAEGAGLNTSSVGSA